MQRGIMIFNLYDWKIWIGQQAYETFEGMAFELRIRNRYYKANLGKDDDWFVTLDQDVTFNLRIFEVYKVRMESIDLIPEFDVPF
jgi:hypothetical protein